MSTDKSAAKVLVAWRFPTFRKSRDVGQAAVVYRDVTVIWISEMGLFLAAGWGVWLSAEHSRFLIAGAVRNDKAQGGLK
jgi:hypothetical protein